MHVFFDFARFFGNRQNRAKTADNYTKQWKIKREIFKTEQKPRTTSKKMKRMNVRGRIFWTDRFICGLFFVRQGSAPKEVCLPPLE